MSVRFGQDNTKDKTKGNQDNTKANPKYQKLILRVRFGQDNRKGKTRIILRLKPRALKEGNTTSSIASTMVLSFRNARTITAAIPALGVIGAKSIDKRRNRK